MIKNDLRKNGFAEHDIIPKGGIITLIWVILTLCMMAGTVAAVTYIDGRLMLDSFDPIRFITEPLMAALAQWGIEYLGFFLYFLVPLLTYFGIRCFMTISACQDRNNSIKLKFLKTNAMPICVCKEALTVKQTVLIYLVPFLATYVPLFVFSVFDTGEGLTSGTGGIYMIVTVILSFFWAFDLTAVIYVLWFKLRTDADYISIDNHIYNVTLFSKSYVRATKKAKKI